MFVCNNTAYLLALQYIICRLYMKISLSVLLTIICFNCFSQRQRVDGCIIVFPYGAVAAFPAVYPNGTGTVVPSGQNYNSDIVGKSVYNTTGGVSVQHSCYEDPNPTTTRQCAVLIRVVNGRNEYAGGVFAQNYYRCAIDDYIPYLVIICSMLGFATIRKYPVKLVFASR